MVKPAIAVYFYCYRALTNPAATAFFQQFKAELLAHSALFPIDERRDLLPEAHRESLFSFNLARLEYQRRALGPALQLLQKADYKDLLLSLAAKMLQLKIFYELTEFDLLESHLQAFGAFIRRKKALGYHRDNYQNTLYFTQKLLDTNRFDKAARAALRAEIEATRALAEREWLLGQV